MFQMFSRNTLSPWHRTLAAVWRVKRFNDKMVEGATHLTHALLSPVEGLAAVPDRETETAGCESDLQNRSHQEQNLTFVFTGGKNPSVSRKVCDSLYTTGSGKVGLVNYVTPKAQLSTDPFLHLNNADTRSSRVRIVQHHLSQINVEQWDRALSQVLLSLVSLHCVHAYILCLLFFFCGILFSLLLPLYISFCFYTSLFVYFAEKPHSPSVPLQTFPSHSIETSPPAQAEELRTGQPNIKLPVRRDRKEVVLL